MIKLRKFTAGHIFFLIFLLGIFLRFYRLPQTMQFLGDQGRDALIVRRMLIEHHPALIGPVTSVGNMYLGPFYYYFMLFPLMLTYPDPTGPAYAVALFGVITLYLIYRLGKQMVGETAAIFASFIFAISPLVLTFSRFSWNPNIVPLFSLLFIWHVYEALKGKDKAWIWVGLWFAILVQLHYITLILGGVAGLVWIYALFTKFKAKTLKPVFFASTVIAILIFLVSLAPLVAFDVRHEYLNSKAFLSFFQGTGGDHFSVSVSLFGRLVTNISILVRNFTGLFSFELSGFVRVLGFLLILFGLVQVWIQNHKYKIGSRLLVVTFLISILGLSFYKGVLFDHYLAFMYSLSPLVIGAILSLSWKKIWLKPIVIMLLIGCMLQAAIFFPGKQNLGYNIYMMQKTASAIESHLSAGETYDILVFTDTNDYQGTNYRYFLTTGKFQPASEEQIHDFKTLFILDEQNKPNPIDGPQYKIAMWPNRKVVDRFDISGGPRVYELKR